MEEVQEAFKTVKVVPPKLQNLKEYSLLLLNIFLWHESEDLSEKNVFPKFQLISILHFQVMYHFVCFIAPTDYRVE